MIKHECPYDGSAWPGHCGDRGHLCDRCKEDRADRRSKLLADTISAFAVIVAGDSPMDLNIAEALRERVTHFYVEGENRV